MSDLRRLLIVAGQLDTGGAERELVTFLRAVREMPLSISVASLSPSGALEKEVQVLTGREVECPPSTSRIRAFDVDAGGGEGFQARHYPCVESLPSCLSGEEALSQAMPSGGLPSTHSFAGHSRGDESAASAFSLARAGWLCLQLPCGAGLPGRDECATTLLGGSPQRSRTGVLLVPRRDEMPRRRGAVGSS